MRSAGLALFSLLGSILWLAFAYVLLLNASLGDGSGGMPITQGRVLLVPVFYFSVLFLCSFRFIKGALLMVSGTLATLALLVFAVGAFAFGWWGFLLWLPFIPYVIASRRLFGAEQASK